MAVEILNLRGTLNGQLSNRMRMLRATLDNPMTLDRTAIHYDTSAGWESKPATVSVKGNLYIYSDYKVIRNEDETVTVIPAFKIGDGTTLLKDLPFNTEDGTAMYDEETETLTFIF